MVGSAVVAGLVAPEVVGVEVTEEVGVVVALQSDTIRTPVMMTG